jgi:hypothetical protein
MEERSKKPKMNGAKHPSPFTKARNVGLSPDLGVIDQLRS